MVGNEKDRNEIARNDLRAKGNAIKEPEVTCEQCANKIADELRKEKIGGVEHKFCSKDCIALFKTNMEEQRNISEVRATKQIKFLEREIDYKENELKTEITETRVLNTIPGQPSVILDGYVDGLKPAYIIQNELERDQQLIKEQRKQIENIKLARKEDASKHD